MEFAVSRVGNSQLAGFKFFTLGFGCTTSVRLGNHAKTYWPFHADFAVFTTSHDSLASSFHNFGCWEITQKKPDRRFGLRSFPPWTAVSRRGSTIPIVITNGLRRNPAQSAVSRRASTIPIVLLMEFAVSRVGTSQLAGFKFFTLGFGCTTSVRLGKSSVFSQLRGGVGARNFSSRRKCNLRKPASLKTSNHAQNISVNIRHFSSRRK
jgi:hypothetical protein